MEWVIALLAVGCAFFAFQIAMDYAKYKSVVGPRLERLEAAREELKVRIETSRTQLAQAQQQLGPVQEEIESLEREYLELQRQIEEARQKGQRPEPPASQAGSRFRQPQ
jgi:chromosome segregation ATPase